MKAQTCPPHNLVAPHPGGFPPSSLCPRSLGQFLIELCPGWRCSNNKWSSGNLKSHAADVSSKRALFRQASCRASCPHCWQPCSQPAGQLAAAQVPSTNQLEPVTIPSRAAEMRSSHESESGLPCMRSMWKILSACLLMHSGTWSLHFPVLPIAAPSQPSFGGWSRVPPVCDWFTASKHTQAWTELQAAHSFCLQPAGLLPF